MTTKEQRAMMAAHLCDILAKALRSGDMYDGASLVSRIVDDLGAEECYRFGLGCYGLAPADIDAACAAIARGEHPADSLPGRVAKMRSNAETERAFAQDNCRDGEEFWEGEVAAFDRVTTLLGCKMTP